jgi:hypothetical protein|tara:strand:+ start:758 stop:931 length:174 start_codon:yes stop_codon:yes gene_type:complete
MNILYVIEEDKDGWAPAIEPGGGMMVYVEEEKANKKVRQMAYVYGATRSFGVTQYTD